MDKLILVLYVDVGNIENKYVDKHVKRIGHALFTEDVIRKTEATTFVIPVRGGGTRIECINPKFVVDNEVVREHRIKLDILNENLDNFIKLQKDGE